MNDLKTEMLSLQSQMVELNQMQVEANNRKQAALVKLKACAAYKEMLEAESDIRDCQDGWKVVWAQYSDCKKRLNASLI